MRLKSLLAIAALVAAPLLMAAGPAAAGDPPLIITPNPAAPGGNITFSGAGCVAHEGDPVDQGPQVYISVEGEDGSTSPAITPAPNGKWSLTISVPTDLPDGKFTFDAVCDGYTDSFQYAPATLVIKGTNSDRAFMFLPAFVDIFGQTPSLSASDSYDVAAFGFEPGEDVTLTIHSTPVLLKTFKADDAGEIQGTFTIPADTEGGAHTLQMDGLDSGLTASEAITVASIATSAPPSTTSTTTAPSTGPTSTTTTRTTLTSRVDTLAATGSPTTELTDIGLLLAISGAGTLLIARRRRGSH